MVLAADQAAAAYVVGTGQAQTGFREFSAVDAGTGAVLRLLQHLLHSRLGQTALGRALQLLAAGGAHQPADDQKDDAHDDDGHRAAQYCADGRNNQAQTGKEFAEARQGTAAAYILHIVIHLSAPFHALRTTRRTGAAPR